MMRSPSVSHLIAEVARATRENPGERKLLVGHTLAQGRELLRALALAGTPWMGWEVTTPRTLAYDVVLLDIARKGEARADEFDLIAVADEAIDAVEERGEAGPFGGTTGSAGYRDAIRRTLDSLRSGGVTPDQLRRARPGDAKILALATMLAEFEKGLRLHRIQDGPELMRLAADALENGRGKVPGGRIFILGGHSLRGPGGRFLRALLAAEHVHLLGTDPVIGLPIPETILWSQPEQSTGPLSCLHAPSLATERPRVELFAAATPTDELREVLRRVLAQEIPWDRVEILTTDSVTYGAALDALARRLEIPVTYSRGLDSRRTRAGRAVEAYLRWIAEDFPADTLRGMLESGDVAPPSGFDEVSGAALARRLRRLKIGWGRDRYLQVIDRAIADAQTPGEVDEDSDPEELELRALRDRRELAALHALVDRLLAATPHSARRNGRLSPTTPSALAGGVLAFLELVPNSSEMSERTIRKVLGERLGRMREVLTRQTAWEAAIAIVRTNIVTRIAPAGEGGLAPWISTGGRLYLSDIATGGLSLRPHIFVVGLDAGRVAGATGLDPLITDADRLLIATTSRDPVPPIGTTGQRVTEGRHALAATLARLRGKITLSYSAWESAEGRSISPAPELLQALRLRSGDEALTYDALRDELGPLAGAVPTGAGLLDSDDVWLDAISNGRVLRAGTDVVRSVFRGLDRGLRAQESRRSAEVTAYDGLVPPRPELDARAAGTVFSASRLQTLGTCPRSYFYQYVLGVKPTEDPVLDPDVWLDAMHRGNVLHAIYERTLTEARRDSLSYEDERFAQLALEIMDAEAAGALRHSPPPSQAILEAELLELREEVLTWVAMIRRDRPDWMAVELRFGPGAAEAVVETAAGPIRVRGAIDRVDRVPGGLRIIDYKTGGFAKYRVRRPFNGGRRIQHVLYTLAAEQILGEPVAAMEYQFPTRKGQMRRFVYGSHALARGSRVLDALLEMAAAGHFVATEECKDCSYCDFARICRARSDDWGKVTSERATWSKEMGMGLPEYARLAILRGIDD